MTTATETETSRPTQLLTHSRLQSMTCPRRHFLKYEMNIRPLAKKMPLRFGSAVHEGLDVYKRNKDVGGEEMTKAALAEFDRDLPPKMSEEEEQEYNIKRVHIIELLAGYAWRWQEMDAALEYVASELQFEIPIINPRTNRSSRTFTLAGKLDGIVRLEDGRLAVIEHKTSSDDLSPESDYWKKLLIDSQISIYYNAARHLGYDVQTVIYDVIGKPRIKPLSIPQTDADGIKIVLDKDGSRVRKKNGDPRQTGDKAKGWVLQTRPETPAEYQARLNALISENLNSFYARREIPRMQYDLDETNFEIWQAAKEIRERQKHGRWGRKTSMCSIYSGCEYYNLCTGGYDINDPARIPEGYYVQEETHEELSI